METESKNYDDEAVVESQMESIMEEWSMYNDLQMILANLDDTNASDDECPKSQIVAEKRAQEAVTQCLNSHDCELSQSISPVDVEQMIKVFLFDTGRKNEFRQIDFNTFLENREAVVNVDWKASIATPVASIKRRHSITTFPMPFLIDDVLRIETNGQMWQELNLFNQKFKYVMIYGHLSQDRRRVSCKGNNQKHGENKKRYIIDDGTAKIRILYTHKTDKYSGLIKSVQNLDHVFKAARKYGIPQLGDDFSPDSEVCKTILHSIDVLMDRIRIAGCIPQRHFGEGTKAFVVGAPYKPFPGEDVCLYATELCVDDGLDRTTEIHFKRKLVQLYTNVYLR